MLLTDLTFKQSNPNSIALLILPLPHRHDDLAYRRHNRFWRLFRNAVIAELNDDLSASRGEAGEFRLQLMLPGFMELYDLACGNRIVGLPKLSGRKHDQWSITERPGVPRGL